MDWSGGTYEITAAQIAPASRRLLEVADPQPLQRVLDVACGTGNFALLAARAGADVVGLDAAQRLLDVAAERAAEEGVEVSWIHANATDMPVADAGFELVTSVFGVIFADPPADAAAELKRAVAPGGRIVLTAWVDDGTVVGAITAARESLADLLPGGARGPSPWEDEQGLRDLLAPLEVTIHEERLPFEGDSPQAFNDLWFDRHPMWVGVRDGIPPERYEAARAASLAVLVAGNEARDGSFRATSPYRLVVATAP